MEKLTSQEKAYLDGLVKEKILHTGDSIENIKRDVILEVQLQLLPILLSSIKSRDRLFERRVKFKGRSTGLKSKLMNMKDSFNMNIEHLDLINWGLQFATITLSKAPKILSGTLDFVKKNKKLVPVGLKYFPNISQFTPKASGKKALEGLLKSSAGHIKENPMSYALDIFSLLFDYKYIPKKIYGDPNKEIDQQLRRLEQAIRRVDEQVSGKLSEMDAAIDQLHNKLKLMKDHVAKWR